MLAAGKGSFEKVNAKTTDSATEIFAVACGNKVFVYAYNHSATDKKVSLQIPLKSPAELSYKIFDCEPGVYSKAKKIKVTSADMKLRKILLHANADVVLIISKAE